MPTLNWISKKTRIGNIGILSGLSLFYILAGKLGLRLATVSPSVTAVWAPTGIALTFFRFSAPGGRPVFR